MRFPFLRKPLVLSQEDYDRFIKTCETPPQPSERLLEMFREYGSVAKLDNAPPSEGGR